MRNICSFFVCALNLQLRNGLCFMEAGPCVEFTLLSMPYVVSPKQPDVFISLAFRRPADLISNLGTCIHLHMQLKLKSHLYTFVSQFLFLFEHCQFGA